MNIDGNIWYSSADKSLYDQSENGMVQYNVKADKITQIIQYPQNITPCRQFCCQYNKKIYIIDGENGQIILFDPSTKSFTIKVDIPCIGKYPTAVVVFDKIHIMHGTENYKNWIYNITANTVKIFDDECTDKMYLVAAIKYKDNCIIKWGGWNYSDGRPSNAFMISNIIEDNNTDEIKWELQPNYAFKEPIYNFGYVLYMDIIIIFGGVNKNGIYLNTISILNLKDKKTGWIELKHIKCPLKSDYIATITEDCFIHILSEINQWPDWENSERGHYSIHISTILGSTFCKQ